MMCNCVKEIDYICFNCESKKAFYNLNHIDKIKMSRYWKLVKKEMNRNELLEYKKLMDYFDSRKIDVSDFDFNLL
jgi:hypothetical protein